MSSLVNVAHSRDDKRYTEKKNKTERARRKKEDTARLRNIVDVALSVDPRIMRIKQEEKEAREAKRKNKTGPGGLSKAQVEEEKRRTEEEAKAKEEADKVRLFHHVQRPFLTDGYVGCEGRGKEGEGRGCKCRQESTACCQGSGRWC